MWKVQQGKQASAHYNGDLLCIKTLSGHRLLKSDSEGAQHLLPPDADDERVGLAVLDALGRSRLLTLEESDAFFEPKRVSREYEEWKQALMKRYGYKSKRGLFTNMLNCGIRKSRGVITISPTVHHSLETWERSYGDAFQDIELPANSLPAESGAALREGFRRCR